MAIKRIQKFPPFFTRSAATCFFLTVAGTYKQSFCGFFGIDFGTQCRIIAFVELIYYQCMIWMQAACPIPDLPAPIDMGWNCGNAGLGPVLMSIAAIPESCLEMISCTCKTQCKSRRCKCCKSQLPCTSMCLCRQQKGDHSITCMNCMCNGTRTPAWGIGDS